MKEYSYALDLLRQEPVKHASLEHLNQRIAHVKATRFKTKGKLSATGERFMERAMESTTRDFEEALGYGR